MHGCSYYHFPGHNCFVTVLQLYLNYRLKSVAHLPWRQMSYKCASLFWSERLHRLISFSTSQLRMLLIKRL